MEILTVNTGILSKAFADLFLLLFLAQTKLCISFMGFRPEFLSQINGLGYSLSGLLKSLTTREWEPSIIYFSQPESNLTAAFPYHV